MPRVSRWLAAAGLAAGLAAASPARAQWISPGQLSAAHAELDGDLHCTACHALRERGIQPRLCLDCHAPLARRVDAGEGFHADSARADCGECHREHFGRDLDLVRLDTASFRHAEDAGFPLRGSHGDAACGDCHRAANIQPEALADFDSHPGFRGRTLLGLTTECAGCHRPDDPHDGQFRDRSCGDCHDEVEWDRPVLFSHDRTAYPLTGRHGSVECADCHPTEDSVTVYTPRPHGGCDACHEDPHGSAMTGACSGCHTTAGWQRVGEGGLASGFRHGATRFPLLGAHAVLDCAACHVAAGRSTDALRIRTRPETRGRAYPLPTGTACADCHVDAHGGQLEDSPGGGACQGCHTDAAWLPTTYDVARHNRLAVFPLAGAHAAVPCGTCHRAGADTALTLELGSTACRSCHAEDDPHEGRFGDRSCDACHGTATFRMTDFDHSLRGDAACADCHADDSPHGGQFGGRGCDACHDTDSYRIPDFPHERTGFALDGAHARTPCASCHPEEGSPVVIRWAGVPRACAACHGGGS